MKWKQLMSPAVLYLSLLTLTHMTVMKWKQLMSLAVSYLSLLTLTHTLYTDLEYRVVVSHVLLWIKCPANQNTDQSNADHTPSTLHVCWQSEGIIILLRWQVMVKCMMPVPLKNSRRKRSTRNSMNQSKKKCVTCKEDETAYQLDTCHESSQWPDHCCVLRDYMQVKCPVQDFGSKAKSSDETTK